MKTALVILRKSLFAFSVFLLGSALLAEDVPPAPTDSDPAKEEKANFYIGTCADESASLPSLPQLPLKDSKPKLDPQTDKDSTKPETNALKNIAQTEPKTSLDPKITTPPLIEALAAPKEEIALFGSDNSKKIVANDSYTINYNNVSILEYVRFVSKICNINFIFNEEDLNFNVTVVSEEPITATNVMSTLIQILRIHDLTLLEQDNNLVIHKNEGVKQFAKIVQEDGAVDSKNPIITRVFRIKNAKVASLAEIIRPMISKEAILEISAETRHLIITDITTNIKKIAELIAVIDSPQNPLEIETYKVKSNAPDYLIGLATQIMNPLSQGNPFILVPQEITGTIFIVSTPQLIEKTIAVLNSLDLPPQEGVKKSIKGATLFVYKIQHRSADELIKSLQMIAQNLQESSGGDIGLVNAIQSLKFIKDTDSILFTATPEAIEKLKEILAAIDMSGKTDLSMIQKGAFFMYKPQHRDVQDINAALREISANLKESDLAEKELIETIHNAKIVESNKSLLFTGDPATFAKVKELISYVDVPLPTGMKSTRATFFLYKIKNAAAEQLRTALKDTAATLKESGISDKDLIATIDNAKYIKETNSLIFTGDEQALKKIQEILPTFDSDMKGKVILSNQFFIYKPEHLTGEELTKSLTELFKSLENAELADPAFMKAAASMQWVPASHSLTFAGDSVSLKKIENIIKTVDIPFSKKGGEILATSQFFIYKPQNVKGEELAIALQETARSLEKARLADPPLLKTINSLQWVPSTNSMIFTGDTESIKKLDAIVKTVDLPAVHPSKIFASTQFYIYKPEHMKGEELSPAFKDVINSLEKGHLADPSFLKTSESMQWVPSTNSLVFTGDSESLRRIESILKTIDIPSAQKKTESRPTYFLYKLQNMPGNIIQGDLDNFALKLKDQKIGNPDLLYLIENIKWIKETNSLLLTGTPSAIDEAKELIVKYDVIRKKGPSQESFFMYKPESVTPDFIQKSLQDVADNLQRAGLADANFLAAIASMKYVESTRSIVFTGDSNSLKKIQDLIKTIDVALPQAIQKVGKATFLIYKVKIADPKQLIAALQALSEDLVKSGTAEKEFTDSLNSAKYVKETRSLLFTGPPEILTKIQPLVEKFDNAALATPTKEAPVPSSYFVYKPIYLSGPSLENSLQEFENHLKSTGYINVNLYAAIESVKWVEKTNSLIISGEPKAVEEIKVLLQTFDVAGRETAPVIPETIPSIDNVSFLVYKLQFHKGDEIQTALRQIGKELALNKPAMQQNLLNAINSIQWIQVTNSLLCSGDHETVSRLKQLIKSLDVPLKQVFIEMLVLRTSFSNLLNFGLDWGGKFKYKNQLAGSFNNFSPAADLSKGSFGSNLNSITSSNPPATTSIPFSSGFDLGVIGDIILHKGRSFLSLGSLLNALQSDGETTIIMTPKVIAQDNKTATIFFGKNIPYVGSLVQNVSQSTLQTTNIEYRDIGMNISLTPVLGNNDIVTLTINLEQTIDLSNSSSNVNIQSSSNTTVTGVTTSKTNMNTTVHLPNNNFLVLSGMVTDNKTKSKSGLPCLGGLPLIGAAFSETDTLASKDNIVIFLRPHIINSYKDLQVVSEAQEIYFKENAGSPALEKDFEEATDSIKSIMIDE